MKCIKRMSALKEIDDALKEVQAVDCTCNADNNVVLSAVLALRSVNDKINKIPSVNVLPVKPGKWLKTTRAAVFRCSSCDRLVFVEINICLYNYCPWCGAKMDGER